MKGWMKQIDSREVRVQTADGEEIKLYLTHDGKLWMSPVIGGDGGKRLEISSTDVSGITLQVAVTKGAPK